LQERPGFLLLRGEDEFADDVAGFRFADGRFTDGRFTDGRSGRTVLVFHACRCVVVFLLPAPAFPERARGDAPEQAPAARFNAR